MDAEDWGWSCRPWRSCLSLAQARLTTLVAVRRPLGGYSVNASSGRVRQPQGLAPELSPCTTHCPLRYVPLLPNCTTSWGLARSLFPYPPVALGVGFPHQSTHPPSAHPLSRQILAFRNPRRLPGFHFLLLRTHSTPKSPRSLFFLFAPPPRTPCALVYLSLFPIVALRFSQHHTFACSLQLLCRRTWLRQLLQQRFLDYTASRAFVHARNLARIDIVGWPLVVPIPHHLPPIGRLAFHRRPSVPTVFRPLSPNLCPRTLGHCVLLPGALSKE